MNISPHLLMDTGLMDTGTLSSAMTITLVPRYRGNAVRKKREIK